MSAGGRGGAGSRGDGGGTSSPTLETVAAAAGVSRATVSRVVNGGTRVSPEIRAAVEAAIAELGYSPNRAARSLVTRRTGSVALVVSEPEARVFSDPMLAGITRAIGKALAETDLHLVLMMAPADAARRRLTRYLLGGHVDGVLLMSLHGDEPLLKELAKAALPVVLMGRPMSPLPIPHVDSDSVDGARQATAHLRALGRTKIATIAGPADMCAGVDRLLGYVEALNGAPGIVAHGDFSMASGEAAMTELLRREPDLDGVFAASDLMAAGALRALRAAGRRVPEDVALVGYDDLDVAELTEPPLTTIHQPLPDMARAMVASLLTQIGGEHAPESVVLPNALVVRASA
ncbi:DNA-binding LacI/PurR family transcriptional regulator [Catenulispora sp. EB89]|uniref:LacI family DNA-binding transcriptional regulator n=1 Tax=Catenulispora sp. EB89 TaxID=3156257 RepID=UPI0035159673